MEKDSMGEMEVPADAYYGASTQRAVLNFPISGQPFPRRFIRALGMVKKAAAQTNRELGLLSRRRARAITAAAQEVIEGTLDGQFPIDIYQTGSGTSTNTNANEVIANRANEILGARLATIHNLHYYLTLLAELRQAIVAGTLDRYTAQFKADRARVIEF